MQRTRNPLTFLTILVILNLTTTALWPQARKELVERRNRHSKTFDNGNGAYTTEIGTGYTHYRTARGQMRDIDPNFRSSADPERSVEVTQGLYEVFFDKSAAGAPFCTFRTQSGGEIKFRLHAMAYYDRPAKNHVVLSQAVPGESSYSGNRATFSGIFPNVDIRYEYTGTKFKEEILLSQRARESLPDPASLGFRNDNVYLAFLTQFEVDSTFEAFSGNVNLGRRRGFDHEGEERIDFRTPGGRTKFFFPLDFAYFDHGVQTDSTAARYESKKVLKRLLSTEEGDFLFAAIPYQWLQELPGGTVAIDPTIAIQPDGSVGKDNFIYKGGSGNDNYGANAGLQVAPDQGSFERRALVKFDVSDVPGSATIVSAKLYLYLYSTWGSGTYTVEAHKVLRDWAEGDGVSWNNNSTSGSDWVYADEPASTQWNASGMESGTDYSATILGTSSVSSSDDDVWKTLEVGSAVTDWLATPSSNYGLALIRASADAGKAVGASFYSSDYTADLSLRAKLVVTYTFGDLAEYNYTPSGAVNSVTFNSGDSTYSGVFDYNERDWVTGITYESESDVTLFDIDYFHDDVGNIDSLGYGNLSESDQVGYEYDNLNRLTKATSNQHNDYEYAYDKNGNIDWKKINGAQTQYDYTATGKPNRLTAMGGNNISHDANGNMTQSHSGDDYSYDHRNQIVHVDAGSSEEFYDMMPMAAGCINASLKGRRIWRTSMTAISMTGRQRIGIRRAVIGMQAAAS